MRAVVVPPVLLVVVAVWQIGLAKTVGLTPWKGGGFGMFATLDHGAYRGVDIVVEAPDRSEAQDVPPSLEELAARTAMYPSESFLRRLAEAVVAREQQVRAPGDDGQADGLADRVRSEDADGDGAHPSHVRVSGRRIASPVTMTARRSLEWFRAAACPAHLEIPLRLTAIALLLRPMGPWFVRPAVLAAAALVLIAPRVLRTPAVWAIVAVLVAVRIADDWPLADNHIYLLAYWALAIALSLRAPDISQALSTTSRWLLGLAFAFAVLWKVLLSPDFIDGRFFRVTLLTDPRFAEAAMLIGGLSDKDLEANRRALSPLPEGAALAEPLTVVEPPRLRALAAVSTWGIVLLETSVALMMLGPRWLAFVWLRHALLLTFCLVTYAFAPVAGFGWLLLVMGAAQTAEPDIWARRAYVAAFLVVLFYSEVPWAGLLLDFSH